MLPNNQLFHFGILNCIVSVSWKKKTEQKTKASGSGGPSIMALNFCTWFSKPLAWLWIWEQNYDSSHSRTWDDMHFEDLRIYVYINIVIYIYIHTYMHYVSRVCIYIYCIYMYVRTYVPTYIHTLHYTTLHTILFHTIPYHYIPYHTITVHTIPYHTIPFHTIPYTHTYAEVLGFSQPYISTHSLWVMQLHPQQGARLPESHRLLQCLQFILPGTVGAWCCHIEKSPNDSKNEDLSHKTRSGWWF